LSEAGNPREYRQEVTETRLEGSKSSYLGRVIDIQLLFLINKRPLSGYDLRRSMKERFHITLSYGTLYPHLLEFEKKNLVVGNWSYAARGGSKRRIYTITEKGRVVLREYLSGFALMYAELGS
jgi:PadR family transcriptional regulator PadR